MPDLSIVIVSWNAAPHLRACLASILEHPPGRAHEVVVVDNASTDGSAAMVRRDFPGVILLENPRNAGFAAASNAGFRRSGGRYVLFLNPDTAVREGTFDRSLAFVNSRPDVGIMGCRTVSPAGRLQPTAFGFPSIPRMAAFVLGLNRVLKVSRFKAYSRVLEPFYVQGSFLFVRREAFDAAGGFDEGYFVYFEDADLCRKARAAGWKVVYFPGAEIVHVGGGSSPGRLAALELFLAGLVRFYASARPARRGRLRAALRAALWLRFGPRALVSRAGRETLRRASGFLA